MERRTRDSQCRLWSARCVDRSSATQSRRRAGRLDGGVGAATGDHESDRPSSSRSRRTAWPSSIARFEASTRSITERPPHRRAAISGGKLPGRSASIDPATQPTDALRPDNGLQLGMVALAGHEHTLAAPQPIAHPTHQHLDRSRRVQCGQRTPHRLWQAVKQLTDIHSCQCRDVGVQGGEQRHALDGRPTHRRTSEGEAVREGPHVARARRVSRG